MVEYRRSKPRQSQFLNSMAIRQSFIQQNTSAGLRQSILSMYSPKPAERTPERGFARTPGSSGIAMPWSGVKKRGRRF